MGRATPDPVAISAEDMDRLATAVREIVAGFRQAAGAMAVIQWQHRVAVSCRHRPFIKPNPALERVSDGRA